MKIMTIFLFVLCSVTTLCTTAKKLQGEHTKIIKKIIKVEDSKHKKGKYCKYKRTPCTYLKHLINKVERLSKDIIANLSKRRAKFRSQCNALKEYRRALRRDLKKLDRLIRKVKRNRNEIHRAKERAKYFRDKLHHNKKETCSIEKEMKRLNIVLHHLAHEHQVYLNRYLRAKGRKNTLISENRKYRRLIHKLNKDIACINKNIVKTERKRCILRKDLNNCRWALKKAHRMNKKCKKCKRHRRHRRGRKYYRKCGKRKNRRGCRRDKNNNQEYVKVVRKEINEN